MLPDTDNRLVFPHMARHNLRHAAARDQKRARHSNSSEAPKNNKTKKCVGFSPRSDDEGRITIIEKVANF